MKKWNMCLLVAVGCCLSWSAVGQVSNDSLLLRDLAIPSAPGFMLLDKAPTAIERPNTTQAFTISMLNNLTDGSGLPRNYAIEVTPFWFFKNHNMTAERYLGFGGGKPQPFAFAKMATLSLAYTNTSDSLSGRNFNNVAVGLRTNLVTVYPKQQKNKVQQAIKANVDKLLRLDSLYEKAGANDALAVTNPKRYQSLIDSVGKAYTQEYIASPLEEALRIRPIFAIDGAVAYSIFFRGNNFDSYQFGRLGAWLTLNYSQHLNKDYTNYLHIYALGRYLADGTQQNSQGEYIRHNFTDVGAKIELEFNKFSLSYEYIYRLSDNGPAYRSTGMLKYQLSRNVYFTGSLGKNFGTGNNLISLLGLNWGFATGNERASLE